MNIVTIGSVLMAVIGSALAGGAAASDTDCEHGIDNICLAAPGGGCNGLADLECACGPTTSFCTEGETCTVYTADICLVG